MAIVKMKKLRVIAMAECRRELLHQLQRLGCVEIREPESTGEAWEGLLRRESARPAETKAALADARTALAAAERYGKIKGGLLIKRRPVTEAEFSAAAPQARETVGRITARLRTIADLQGETARLAARQAALLPWKDLDLPLEAEGTEDIRIVFQDDTAHLSDSLSTLRRQNWHKKPALSGEPGLWYQITADGPAGRDQRAMLEEREAGAIHMALEPDALRITRYEIVPDCRGMGLGTQLMGQAVQYARHQGREKIVLTCGGDTEAFFAQFGFVTVGRSGENRDMEMDIRLVIREIAEE